MAKEKQKERLHDHEIEELAQYLIGKHDDDLEISELEKLFYDKYEIDLERFVQLMKDLWPLLSIDISPITETPFIGFADEENGIWLVKKNARVEFIRAVINWMGGPDLKDDQKEFARTITSEGNPKYEITLTKALPKVDPPQE